MDQFTVPQFIDVEDKVVGSLSVRQFLILLAAGGLGFVYYKLFYFVYFVSFTVLTVLLAGVFAFVKIGGVAFHYFLLNFFQVFKKPRIRVWAKEFDSNTEETLDPVSYQAEPLAPRSFTSSHLNQLALIVDTRGYYTGETDEVNILEQTSSRI